MNVGKCVGLWINYSIIIKKRGKSVFRGVHQLNLDVKGRMAMPAKHRDALISSDQGQLIATIDINVRCLLIYPLSEWLEVEKKIQELPAFKPGVRQLQRLMLGHASEVEFDGSGRVLLPAVLREYAGLDKKIVLVGQGKKFELWGEDQWNVITEQAIADANSGKLEIPDEIQQLVF